MDCLIYLLHLLYKVYKIESSVYEHDEPIEIPVHTQVKCRFNRPVMGRFE